MAKKPVPKKRRKKKSRMDKFKEHVKKTVRIARDSAYLQDYHIVIRYKDEQEDTKPGYTALASCITSTEYQEAFMDIYPALFDHWLDGDLFVVNKAICHELGHLRTELLYELATKRFTDPDMINHERERLTEAIGRYIQELAGLDKQ